MRADFLRIGNTVKTVYENRLDTVIAIEEGSVHLANKAVPDDERDIEGASINAPLLKALGFIELTPDNKRFAFCVNGQTVIRLAKERKGWFCEGVGTKLHFKYIHELQNLLHALNLAN